MSEIQDIEKYVSQLKVVDLREGLKKRHLSYTGNKKDLAQRLAEAMLKEKQEAAAQEEGDVDVEAADTEASATEGNEEPAEEEAEEKEEEQEDTAAAEEQEAAPAKENGKPEQQEDTAVAMDTEEMSTEESEVDVEGGGAPAAGGEDSSKMDTEQQATTETETSAKEEGNESKTEETKNEDEDDVTKEGGGVKRPLEEDKSEEEKKPEKVDPSKAPDPEEPEKFDESALKSDLEEQFNPPEDDVTITLDRYNSDLHFKISPDGLGGSNLTDHGFCFLWAAARATWGVKTGKYCFEMRVEENLTVDMPETEEHPHAIRVGWSIDQADLGLGEVDNSYGYGGTGKTSSGNKFYSYGEAYGPGDVIGCFLDLESTPRTLFFSKNGKSLETAFTLEENECKDRALFPHVATKNIRMSLNFSSPLWNEVEGVEGFVPLQEAEEEHKVRATKGPASASDCEVLMMIGLPASGKTTWAEKHCKDNPEKRFTILGTNLIMDKMKVTGLARKQNYHGRWEALIKQSTEVLNAMFLLAGKNLRNYIIDQTNVYDGAQRRKMSYFVNFQKKAVVVVPPHHILRQRTAKRTQEMGQPVPEDAINAMKANFHVPRKGAIFEDVIYAEIYGVAADKIVRQYREDALGLPSYPTSKRGRYDRSPHGGGGGGGRFGGGPPRRGGGGGGGYPPYPPYSRPSSYYGYSRGPPYPPYGPPPPPPHHPYGHGPPPPRGGGYGRHPPYPPHPYGGGGRDYGGRGYGPPPPRGGGGGYYGRY